MPCILQAQRRPLSHHTSAFHPLCCFLLLLQNTVPAKGTIPLIIPQKISCLLSNGMKRLFPGNEKHKTIKKESSAPFPRLIIFPFSFYRFSQRPFCDPPIYFGKTLYNLTKTADFCQVVSNFRMEKYL